MWSLKPSEPFRAFEFEVNNFIILIPGTADFRFEAKQRLIERSEGFAIREAYSVGWWWLFVPKATRRYFEGLKRYERQLTENPYQPGFFDTNNPQRHRAEICINLYARTLQQFIQRRLYTIAVVAATVGVIVAAIGLKSCAASTLGPPSHEKALPEPSKLSPKPSPAPTPQSTPKGTPIPKKTRRRPVPPG